MDKKKKTPAQRIRDYFNKERWKRIFKKNNDGKYKHS